jgi:two-component system NtrC family sensor kinase
MSPAQGSGLGGTSERDPDDQLPKVLLVDDIEANLVAAEALLEGLPCVVVRARSGNEALRELLRQGFAVILLDVQMPVMDGYEVARHARSNPATRDVPIIFLTAMNSTPDNELRGYGSGAVDVLYKPVTPTILRSKVAIFLELAAARRGLASANAALETTNEELRALAETKAALAESFRRANEELTRTNLELKETQSKLVQSAKMASLGELVAGIAHEINNPLAFVVSHLDTVRRSLVRIREELNASFSENVRQHWDRADNRLSEMNLGLERIRDLVVKLRTFSRLDEGERKRVSIRECIDSVLTILNHRTGDRIRLSTHYGQPDVIDCYPGLLNQAVMNLVTNAIDAIDGPGDVIITTGQVGTSYEIVVEDTGRGIPHDLRERVLEPFFTTKPVGQGTGLGLSITYSIVEKHCGNMELQEREGGGTRVIVRVPLLPYPGNRN